MMPRVFVSMFSSQGPWGAPSVGGGDGNVFLVWDTVGGATSYVVQIGSDTALSDVLNLDVGNVLEYATTLAAGTYYARIVPQGAGSTTAEQVITV